ncbi:cilia- and flagella-associated protein 144 [Gouania willdenowi]|uniref:Protein FAM183A n=1 Tax=Gouania willdenowi TaxID=441366 RepID=A0A8C5F031_GOUWI|nr:protein FAM183A [Gouania willdenowi]
MTEREKPDLVHLNAIHREMIKKEQKLQKIHTEFNINPHRKLHILPEKPMSRKSTDAIAENTEFLNMFHKAHEVPSQKYSNPITESQEIGWISTPLIPANRKDERFNFCRKVTDVTKHQEMALRSSSSILKNPKKTEMK